MATFFGETDYKMKKKHLYRNNKTKQKRKMRKYILYKCGTNRETKEHKITRK